MATAQEIARRFGEELWAGDIDGMSEYIAEDIINHALAPGAPNGLAGTVAEVTNFRAIVPDLQVHNEDVIVSGDKIVLRWTARGTQQAPMFGHAPTGAPLAYSGIDILRVQDGKIVERWIEYDARALQRQVEEAAND
jgi:predicted ester cyclase